LELTRRWPDKNDAGSRSAAPDGLVLGFDHRRTERRCSGETPDVVGGLSKVHEAEHQRAGSAAYVEKDSSVRSRHANRERLAPRSPGHGKGRFDQAALEVGPRYPSIERGKGALSMIERLSSGQVHLDATSLIEHERQYAGLGRASRRCGSSDLKLCPIAHWSISKRLSGNWIAIARRIFRVATPRLACRRARAR
jgi:hypothetical protein